MTAASPPVSSTVPSIAARVRCFTTARPSDPAEANPLPVAAPVVAGGNVGVPPAIGFVGAVGVTVPGGTTVGSGAVLVGGTAAAPESFCVNEPRTLTAELARVSVWWRRSNCA